MRLIVTALMVHMLLSCGDRGLSPVEGNEKADVKIPRFEATGNLVPWSYMNFEFLPLDEGLEGSSGSYQYDDFTGAGIATVSITLAHGNYELSLEYLDESTQLVYRNCSSSSLQSITGQVYFASILICDKDGNAVGSLNTGDLVIETEVMAKPEEISSASALVRARFQQNCTSCHSQGGSGNLIDVDAISGTEAYGLRAAAIAAIEDGSMPQGVPAAWSDEVKEGMLSALRCLEKQTAETCRVN